MGWDLLMVFFPDMIVNEQVTKNHLYVVNIKKEPALFLHPSALFLPPLPELPKEVFIFEKRGQKRSAPFVVAQYVPDGS